MNKLKKVLLVFIITLIISTLGCAGIDLIFNSPIEWGLNLTISALSSIFTTIAFTLDLYTIPK